MPRFQINDARVFSDTASGLKPWPETADGRRLYLVGDSGQEWIGIQVGKSIALQLKGLTSGAVPEIDSSKPAIVGVLQSRSAVGDTVPFVLEGKAAGTALIRGYDSHKNVVAGPLHVMVGTVGKHMENDLIADVLKGDDPLKIHAIQRMLYNNPDNIFEQSATCNIHSKHGGMACGIVAKFRGDQIFGHMSKVEYDNPYHEPLARGVTKRSDVKYAPERLLALTTHIAAMLRSGKPVRVGVLDGPVGMAVKGGKLIAYLAGGHTVLIVGCNKAATEFLYIDPWGSGSTLVYNGGIPGMRNKHKCRQLGMFELVYDSQRVLKSADSSKPNLLRQSLSSEGTFGRKDDNFLEVVAGPFLL